MLRGRRLPDGMRPPPPQVGRKSLNLAVLRGQLLPEEGLKVPAGVTLPFGTFERTLEANGAAADEV